MVTVFPESIFEWPLKCGAFTAASVIIEKEKDKKEDNTPHGGNDCYCI
uniref:Uncharacterized protein n=1 Tax=Anguilla anguilla TaxID=7936 RepID=A0A0E9RQF1_ANGAN